MVSELEMNLFVFKFADDKIKLFISLRYVQSCVALLTIFFLFVIGNFLIVLQVFVGVSIFICENPFRENINFFKRGNSEKKKM